MGDMCCGNSAVVLCPVADSIPTALGVIRCLGRAAVHVTAIALPGSTFAGSRYARRVLPPSSAQLEPEDRVLEHLLAVGEAFEEPLPLFVASDASVRFVHENWGALSAFYRYPIMPRAALSQCLDKVETVRAARAASVRTPATFSSTGTGQPSSTMVDFPYPCVVKPTEQPLLAQARSSGQVSIPPGKAWRAEDEAALGAILDWAGASGIPVVVQEEIGGPDDAIASCCLCVGQHGEVLASWTGLKLRKLPLQCGTATLAQSVRMPELLPIAERLVQAIGLRGICEIEFAFGSRGEPFLLEINPRPWVWVALAERSGVNLPYRQFCDLVGRTCPDLTQVEGPLWVRLWADWTAYRRSSRSRAPARLLLPFRYSASWSRLPEFAFFAWDDPVPGFRSALGMLRTEVYPRLTRGSRTRQPGG